MSKLRQAAEQALEYLECRSMTSNKEVAKTLREALGEPEPVAWMDSDGNFYDWKYDACSTPLYTSPPRREWQRLTDEEILEAFGIMGAVETTKERVLKDGRAIEAKLKEKNK